MANRQKLTPLIVFHGVLCESQGTYSISSCSSYFLISERNSTEYHAEPWTACPPQQTCSAAINVSTFSYTNDKVNYSFLWEGSDYQLLALSLFSLKISSHFFNCVGHLLLQRKLQALEQKLHVNEVLVLLEYLLKIFFHFKLCLNCFSDAMTWEVVLISCWG